MFYIVFFPKNKQSVQCSLLISNMAAGTKKQGLVYSLMLMHFSIFFAALKTFHKSEYSEGATQLKSQRKSAALPHSRSSLTRTVHSPLLIPLQHMLVYIQSGILQQPVSQSAEPTTKAEPRPWVLTQPALAFWWIEEEQCRMWTQAYCRCRSYPNFPLRRQEHGRSKQTRSKTCAKNCHGENLHVTTQRGSTVHHISVLQW